MASLFFRPNMVLLLVAKTMPTKKVLLVHKRNKFWWCCPECQIVKFRGAGTAR